VNPGVCPKCGTDLDHEEMLVGPGYVEAFCCSCSRYYRKTLRFEYEPQKTDRSQASPSEVQT
jgi:hypothetical protein